ncbi:zinc dependent phospholipase C family protein [Massilia sp. ST3]|uniref:zinc dependent phospholipase C family protein n=1 Tax=Massilia sp. ST3 TaxID=2824903 RepID=UPI001B833C03|nr:zinc dependent phospholipase C family protein [Massilia sp. ST3]MBQ5947502.1 zinc dependent phospholipase C family protein [Massilia sp. ST3]
MRRIWLLALVMAAAQCGAFPINPATTTVEDVRKNNRKYWDFVDRFSAPAHERISRMAYRCAAQFTGEAHACQPGGDGKVAGLDVDTVIDGVHWNDDPNNFFHSLQHVTWFFWMFQAAGMEVKPTDPLQHRSHYGDLQFLHAMSPASRSYEETRMDVLDWARFAYDVATGRIRPGARLAGLKADYTFARHFAGLKKNAGWTVKDLFANIGDYKKLATLDLTGDQVRAMALGALLHTVQDSFSTSHVEREGPDHRVVSWLDYASQHRTCHSGGDEELAFLDAPQALDVPVVRHSAWIIHAAAQEERWEDGVAAKFANVIFPAVGEVRGSGGGDCQKHQLVANLTVDGEAEPARKSTVSLLRGGEVRFNAASTQAGCGYRLDLNGASPGVVNVITGKVQCAGQLAVPVKLDLPLDERKSFDFKDSKGRDVQLQLTLKHLP